MESLGHSRLSQKVMTYLFRMVSMSEMPDRDEMRGDLSST